MSTRDHCDKLLMVQADFDGELDAVQSLSLTRHREECTLCSQAWQYLQASRQSMREEASYHPASAALRQRLAADLQALGIALAPAMPHPAALNPAAANPVAPNHVMPHQSTRPAGSRTDWRQRLASLLQGWQAAMGLGLGTAVAAMAAILLLTPAPAVDMTELVLASHLRALQPGHLTDIASNNQHNVKPWFDGRIDFAPPVKNLADRGYPLTGGRMDYLRDRDVAALVYQAGPHIINLLIWPDTSGDRPPQASIREGYNIVHWRAQGMTIWAVSDLSAAELGKFVSTWQVHD